MKFRIASGCGAMGLAFLGGCSAPGVGTTAVTTATPATSVYVVQTNSAAQYGTYISGQSDTILRLPASASGVVAPTSSISAPVNYLIFGIAVDGSGNIYASAVNVNSYVPEILVYAAGASGAATPVRTIAGPATGLSNPLGMAVDASGQLYVLDGFVTPSGPGIHVFAAGANGNAAPVRVIQGPATGLLNPIALALDAAGNMYTVDGINAYNAPDYYVDVFSSTANGNVAPARTIRSAWSSSAATWSTTPERRPWVSAPPSSVAVITSPVAAFTRGGPPRKMVPWPRTITVSSLMAGT